MRYLQLNVLAAFFPPNNELEWDLKSISVSPTHKVIINLKRHRFQPKLLLYYIVREKQCVTKVVCQNSGRTLESG